MHIFSMDNCNYPYDVHVIKHPYEWLVLYPHNFLKAAKAASAKMREVVRAAEMSKVVGCLFLGDLLLSDRI